MTSHQCNPPEHPFTNRMVIWNKSYNLGITSSHLPTGVFLLFLFLLFILFVCSVQNNIQNKIMFFIFLFLMILFSNLKLLLYNSFFSTVIFLPIVLLLLLLDPLGWAPCHVKSAAWRPSTPHCSKLPHSSPSTAFYGLDMESEPEPEP